MFYARIVFFLTGWIISYQLLQAQQFGGLPPSVQWRQINQPAARIIFPGGLDSIAAEVAAITGRLQETTASSIGDRKRKVNIVLQPQTIYPNGYVGLGPFRSEFFLTPSQNSFALGSLPWHHTLAMHEFRHVQQYNNFNVGISNLLRILFGEEGQELGNNLGVPDWFFEGDAVYNETNLSPQGRGRLPYFHNGYRSLWEADKNYSWMKLRNGSLRDYTPDHYQLGYLLVAYGRQKYGDDFWKKVTKDAASFKGFFYPMQQAVARHAGISYKTFRRDALQYFKSGMDKQVDPAPAPRHFIADEEFPAFINDSTIIFSRTTYKKIPAFVIRTKGMDKVLRTRDVSLEQHFSYRNGRVVYASIRPDLRWGWKDYNELQIMDVQTGKQKTLTTRTKYFSPDISADGGSIIAVQVDSGGKSELHILDATNGQVRARTFNPDQLFYTYPKFYNAAQVITAVRNPAGQMSLALVDVPRGTTKYLTPFTYQVLGFPSVVNDTVYFSASYKGQDRLFGYVMSNEKLFLLQHRQIKGTTGYYYPAKAGNQVVWSHFTSAGYLLETAKANEVAWEEVSRDAFMARPPVFGIAVVNNNPADSFRLGQRHAVMRYSRFTGLFNFHSLLPLADDPEYTLSLVGENVLNTMQSELFFKYNRNEQYKQAGLNVVYGGLFPFLSAGMSYTMDRRGLYRNSRIYWNEWEARGGFRLPFNFSKGRHFTRLNAGADFVYNQPEFRGAYKDTLGNQSFGYINSYVNFSNQNQKARQHIYPRLAQSVSLNYKRAVYNFRAAQFLVSGSLYFPGLFMNHNLVLTGAFQQSDSLNQRSFSNSFPFSRGYTAENLFRMVKGGVNYHFPVCYPDAGFGNIVYLLRLRANVFYDHTYVMDARRNNASFRSAGTEMFFDTKWWNQLPLNFGFRYSYLLDRNLFGGRVSQRFEFILPVNILQR